MRRCEVDLGAIVGLSGSDDPGDVPGDDAGDGREGLVEFVDDVS